MFYAILMIVVIIDQLIKRIVLMKNFKGIIALMAIFVLANQCMATPRRKSLTVAQ